MYCCKIILVIILSNLLLFFSAYAQTEIKLKPYTVQKGDNLSKIAQKHNTSASEIKKNNNLKNDNIAVGQVLLIAEGKANITKSTAQVFHTVQNGESLFGLARRYKVSADSIKAWNKMSNDMVKAGTRLLVNKAGFYGSSITTNPSLQMVSEKGMAAMVGTNSPSKKKLALHRTAAVGSHITVVNPSNGESVLVEVIGNEIDDERVVVKLSRAACQELGALSEIFNVVVHYPKPKNQ